MASWAIPTTSGFPSYVQRTALGGREYVLDFEWNEREGRWFLSLFDQDEELLAAGLKIVVGSPLLGAGRTDPRLPPGELVALDLSGGAADPGAADLGDRVVLYYVDDQRRIP